MKEGNLSDHCVSIAPYYITDSIKAKLLVFSLASIGNITLILPLLTKVNLFLLKKIHLVRMIFYLEKVLRHIEEIPETVKFKPNPSRCFLFYSFLPTISSLLHFLASPQMLMVPGDVTFEEVMKNIRALGDKQLGKFPMS